MDDTFDKMFYDRGQCIGGIDESGVIDIAGPLVAACVVLPRIDLHKDDLRIFEVNDCKEIPERRRRYYAEIIWQVATAIGVGEVTPAEIDYLEGPAAIRLAMFRAVAACQTTTEERRPVVPDYLLIDGGPSNALELPIPQLTIRKGDTKSLAIASASIVAKVYRDECMLKLHDRFPYYGWNSNKGHHCDAQLQGLDRYGIQVGVHRLKSWPFVAHKTKERRKLWHQTAERRALWKATTLQRLLSAQHQLVAGPSVINEIEEIIDGSKNKGFERGSKSRS